MTTQVTLNAAVLATGNGTAATAQDISGSFTSLGTGGVSRGAVIGSLPAGVAAGDVWVSEHNAYYYFENYPGGEIALYDNNLNLLRTINNPALSAGIVSGVQIAPDNTIYVGVDTSDGGYGGYGNGGELVHFDTNGNLLGIVNLPNEASGNGYDYPNGFKVAADGTFRVPQPGTGNVIHVDSSGNLLQSYYVGGSPEDVTVRADGQVFIANGSISRVQQSTRAAAMSRHSSPTTPIRWASALPRRGATAIWSSPTSPATTGSTTTTAAPAPSITRSRPGMT